MKIKTTTAKFLSLLNKGSIASVGAKDVEDGHSDYGIMSVTESGIQIKATNAKVTSSSTLVFESSDICEGVSKLALSFSKLETMLKVLPKDSELSFDFIENRKEEFIGTLNFSSGKSRWQLPCVSPEIVADVKVDVGNLLFPIEREIFLEIISLISFAADLNDPYYTNMNICVSVSGGKINFAATDTIRCSVFSIPFPQGSSMEDARFLLPIENLSKIVKSFEKGIINLYLGEGFIRFEQGGFNVKMSVPDGSDPEKFPPFEGISFKDHPFKIRIMSSRFKSMISACKEINEKEFLMSFDGISSEINVLSFDKISGMRYDSALPYTGDKFDAKIGVCSMFLNDYLKKVKEDVLEMEFPCDQKPKYLKISNGVGSIYIMKSLIDLVDVPEKKKETDEEV